MTESLPAPLPLPAAARRAGGPPDAEDSFPPIPQIQPGDSWPVDVVERLNQHHGELAERMGIRITEARPDGIRATMPVVGNRQPMGLLHGGASAVLAESIGSMLAALLAPEGRFPVGIELSCAHHRSATSGTVTAVAKPLVIGRTLATLMISLTDENDRPVCTARLTCLYRTPPG
ncbi:MAG: hotdog fold thioesterase [Candidatus Nanopelagicales bacterium]|nr:hotdog fold thioesterase [Candidatus Nanopelagicales bacterium]MDZ4250506.1 hotdog fold thioesterase [Candidatus Nanopelagicales bacterium]